MLKILTKTIDIFKTQLYNQIVKKINKKGGKKMIANIEAIKELIKERFRGNITWFAEEIGMDATYVSTILNNPDKRKSDRFCNLVIKYCELNNLDFKNYIFLD